MAEFYSESKQKSVSIEDYQNSKYLYLTLKVRNLSDMNDLYNVQDALFLSEILEKDFK